MGNFFLGQIDGDVDAGGGQQGTDQNASYRRNPCQSIQSGAPGQVEQEGLRVVIGIVGGGDLVGAQLLGGGGEKAVAHGAGGFLHPFALFLGLLGHVAPAHHQGDAPLLAPLDHEVLVPLGLLPPQLMVEVGGVEGEGPGFGQGLQHGEQGHGICAPGQGAEDGAPLGEHIILVGKSRRLGGQVNRVLHNYAPQRRRQ